MLSFHAWQYVIAALTLLFGTLISHWALLYKFPRSLVFWKEVDYSWLFASVVAVFLAVASNQFNDANTVKEGAYRRYLDSQKEFNDSVERINKFDCKKTNSKTKNFAAYCDWLGKFNIQRKTFEKVNGFPSEYWNHLYTSPIKEVDYRNLKWASEIQQSGLIEYNKASSNADKSDNFTTLNYFLVPVLCILLVLRITKITADVIAEKSKAKLIELPKSGVPIIGRERRKFFIDKENKKEESEKSSNVEILKVLVEIKKDLARIIENTKL